MVTAENTEKTENEEPGKEGAFASWSRTSSSVSSVLSVMAMCFLAAATLASACTVSDTGLGPIPDAGPTTGVAICPERLIDQANWPAGTTYASCIKPCGPDGIGTRTCGQTDKATCQATSGCVCLDPPCVACADCEFPSPSPSACYVPTNAASAPACAEGVARGGACSPACGQRLCLEADGRTGCVCNDQGKYACATWAETTWK